MPSFPSPSFFFFLRKARAQNLAGEAVVFPRGKQRSQASSEMPHVQVVGHESHEDEVPPSPLSRRVVCGSVHGAVQ